MRRAVLVFDTIFATFALLIIADLDDKVIAIILPYTRTSEEASRDQESDEI